MTSKPTHGKAMLMHLFSRSPYHGREIPAPTPIPARLLASLPCYACPAPFSASRYPRTCNIYILIIVAHWMTGRGWGLFFISFLEIMV